METSTSFAQGQLKALIERIERLEEEKKTIADDIKEIYGEAKAFGLDAKIIRKVVALRKVEPNSRAEQLSMLRLYCEAVGVQLELFDYARPRNERAVFSGTGKAAQAQQCRGGSAKVCD